MTKLWLDEETYSEVPLAKGSHAYAEKVEIMLVAWAIDEGPVQVWDRTADKQIPAALRAAMVDPTVEVWAHNSHFDRTMARWNKMPIAIERWRDTMVQAMAHGLPGGLDQLCEILKVPTDKAKDKAGKALIQLFCKPRPFSHRLTADDFQGATLKEKREALKAWAAEAKKYWDGRATRATHPAQWAQFVEYAALDIAAMREVHRRLPTWNYSGRELALWHLDQVINDRGVAIDLQLAEAAVSAVDRAQVALAKRTRDLTNDEVQAATQRDAMLEHVLKEYGVDLPNMQMATLERRIADPDLPAGLKELLQVRLQASTTSTSKYKTLLKGTSSDGRLRGLLQFCGAQRTGRWAGRLFQPQNLPRPTLKQDEIDLGIDALLSGCADVLFDNVMQLTSSAIRGCIVAPSGRKLVIADLSNIEGRVQAWLAGEEWKLKAFRAFDAGTGPDLYKLAYGKSFGVKPDDVTKDQRQVGKVQELALGYEGGVGAFVTFAAAYNIDLEQLADQAADAIPGNVWGQANIMFDWHKGKKKRDPAAALGLSQRAWLTCESFKLAWRDAHARIATFWKLLDEAVRSAIECPGHTFPCRMLKVRRDGNWLRIGLPSGRAICYPSPQIVDGKITYMGINQYSRKWCRLDTYGGKLFENVCQAVARDVMAHNMPAIEQAGYEIVLSVHDELLTETPLADEFNAEQLSSLLAATPPWAPDMPLAAAGFETDRYKKD
ncbi:MAG: DNA polymerase I [Telluria sp.]